MPVRQIQNRIFVQLSLASILAYAGIVAVFVWFLFEERNQEHEKTAALLLELVTELDGGSDDLPAKLAAVQDRFSGWSGRPQVFLSTGDELFAAETGEVALPTWVLDRLLDKPGEPLNSKGASFWLKSKFDSVSGSRIHAIARLENASVLALLSGRHGALVVAGLLLLLLIGTYSFYLHRRWVFRPLSDLADRIEQRIAGVSGGAVSGWSSRDEIQRLSGRYEELVELVDRQRGELRLRSDELRQLLDALPAYVWYKDDKNNIVRVNKAGAASAGYEIEELEGKPVAEFFPEEADAYYRDDMAVIDSGEAKLGYIESYTPVNGKARTIRTDKIPYVDSSGKITGVVALVTDISELVGLQEERLASDRLIRRLVEIGNWEATDVDERIAVALKDTCKVLGLSTGVFSEISGSEYKVRQVFDERGIFSVGDTYGLDEVYCSFVVMTGRSIASNHMGSTRWGEMECYKKLGVESYVAAPIRFDGKIAGTINFSAVESRAKAFTPFEVDAVRMIARWVEGLVRQQAIVDQLNSQRAELRLILDTTPNQIWFKDDQNRILRANRAAAESMGMRVEDVEGKYARDVFPEEAQRLFEEDLSVLDSGIPKLGTIRRYESRNGGTVWTRNDKLPYELEDGRRGVISVASDITELLESQNAAQVAEEKFRMAVEASPVGMIIVDPELRVILANNETERIFGYAREEMVWRPVSRLLGERAATALECLFDADDRVASQVRLGSDGQLLALRRDGLEMPVEVILSSYSIAEDRFVMAAVFDITSRFESQKALLDSEERFQLAATGASVGIWDWFDIEGDKQWWSPRFYELLGYDYGELKPTLDTFRSLVHLEELEATFAAVDLCFKEGTAFSTDYRLLCKDGEYRWFLGSGMVSLDEKGLPRRMTGTIQDINDRKVAEEELSRVVTDLKRANEELSNFAYLSSHDLQEPLRTISSFLTLIKDNYGGKLDEEANEYMDFTLVGVSRLQKMIRSLLQYCRLDSANRKAAIFNLRAAVDLALSDLRKRIEESGAEMQIAQNLPEIAGDLEQLSLVFQNLFSNAIKFNRSSRPKVVLEWSRMTAEQIGGSEVLPGDYVVVTVADNGIGIREKYQKRIFSIFQKLHPSGEYDGSGIGLSMVQKIIQRHNGLVWLESGEGKGTRFFLAFPIKL